MSFKVGVKTAGDKDWVYNGLRFGTKEETEAYGRDLFHRWLLITEWEAHESSDHVNYVFVNGGARWIDEQEKNAS